MADKLDGPLIEVLSNAHFPDDIREARLDEFTAPAAGTRDLHERRRRLGRAYAPGAFTDAEFKARLDELDREMSAATPPSHEEADSIVELISDFGQLMESATDEEQQRILSHLVVRGVADLDGRVLGGIVPQPAFASLLRRAIDSQPSSELLLVPTEKCGLVGGRGLEPLTFRV